jgi:predicted transcriptional regulator
MKYDLMELIQMRECILSKQSSERQKEIVEKLDELILAQLNDNKTEDDEIPF